MKNSDFTSAVNNTPSYVAEFTVTNVPAWAEDLVAVADKMTWNNKMQSMQHSRTKKLVDLGPSYLAFVRYAMVVNGEIQ